MTAQTKETAVAAKAALNAFKTRPAESGRAKADAPKPAGETGSIVLVRGPEDGRRRGGRAFGPVDVEIDLGEIGEANMRAILDDPHLSVRPKPPEADEGEPKVE